MLVPVRISISGNGYNAGEVVQLEADHAARQVARGAAEYVQRTAAAPELAQEEAPAPEPAAEKAIEAPAPTKRGKQREIEPGEVVTK